ncbi:MAG: hypothetical protein ACRCTJ_03510, partial [Brevinema sp.]
MKKLLLLLSLLSCHNYELENKFIRQTKERQITENSNLVNSQNTVNILSQFTPSLQKISSLRINTGNWTTLSDQDFKVDKKYIITNDGIKLLL